MGTEKTENESIYNTSDDNTNSAGGSPNGSSAVGWIVFVVVLVGAVAFGTYEYNDHKVGNNGAATPAASANGQATAPAPLDNEKLPSAGTGTNLYAPAPSNNSSGSSPGSGSSSGGSQ